MSGFTIRQSCPDLSCHMFRGGEQAHVCQHGHRQADAGLVRLRLRGQSLGSRLSFGALRIHSLVGVLTTQTSFV